MNEKNVQYKCLQYNIMISIVVVLNVKNKRLLSLLHLWPHVMTFIVSCTWLLQTFKAL